MAAPSSNWLALKRSLSSSQDHGSRPTKRRKLNAVSESSNQERKTASTTRKHSTSAALKVSQIQDASSTATTSAISKIVGDPDSIDNLAAMILRPTTGEETAKPTKFLALDCEMVGVGPFGLESALARVTVVNFVGDVIMDEFVLPQEAVTDWRTAVSGVRREDMAKAKPFIEVQARVAELLKDRYLVGHALKNDLDALLLSHPWLHTRDTQGFRIFKSLTRSQRPALRKLVKQVFNITIQEGEHSSVIDARAPMALYRLYRKEWERGGAVKEPLEATVLSPSLIVATAAPRSPNRPVTHTVTAKKDEAKIPLSKSSLKASVNANPVKSLTGVTSGTRTAEAGHPRLNKKSKGISSGLSVIVMKHTRGSNSKSIKTKGTKAARGGLDVEGRNAQGGKEKPSDGWWKVFGS